MIEPWVYPALTAVAVLTGFIDAVAGGGGLIMLPALLFAGASPIQALATNKLQSVFGTAVATRNYARAGLVNWRDHKLAMLLVFIGATIGVLLVQTVDAVVLSLIIPLLLISVAIYVLVSPRMTDEDAHQRLSERGYAPVGGLVGLYDGFFGPGTGSFFTTSLVALRGFGLTRATAVTKLLNFTSNVASVLFFALGGKMLCCWACAWRPVRCSAAGSDRIARYASAPGLSGRCWSSFRLD